jgi:predicted short-subunit dehydrogenase-like oxidoreductase (DUF2520 family)
MDNLRQKKIAIIGAGKVGIAVGSLLQKQGLTILGVASRSSASLTRAAHFINNTCLTQKSADLVKKADIVFITTNDDQILPVCQQLADQRAFRREQSIFHFSGSLTLEVLEPASKAGAKIGSIHPLQSFADIKEAIKLLPGSYFALTMSDELIPLAEKIVQALGGRAIRIEERAKLLYHISACVASNFFVSLIHLAKSLLEKSGYPEKEALPALLPLIEGTLANIRNLGPVQALTGPIARGDTKIIQKHFNELKKESRIRRLYQELALYTVDIALAKGGINKEKAIELRKVLGEKNEG